MFRTQKQAKNDLADTGRQSAVPAQAPVNDAVTFDTDWCEDADDWGDEDEAGGDEGGLDDAMNQLGIVKEKSFAAEVVGSDNQTSFLTRMYICLLFVTFKSSALFKW